MLFLVARNDVFKIQMSMTRKCHNHCVHIQQTNQRQEVVQTQLDCCFDNVYSFFYNSSLQCYSVLSDILVKNELCIPLERGLNVLSTGEGFICLSPPVSLKSLCVSVFIYKKTISFSAIVF